jgi:hypothetical protein
VPFAAIDAFLLFRFNGRRFNTRKTATKVTNPEQMASFGPPLYQSPHTKYLQTRPACGAYLAKFLI